MSKKIWSSENLPNFPFQRLEPLMMVDTYHQEPGQSMVSYGPPAEYGNYLGGHG